MPTCEHTHPFERFTFSLIHSVQLSPSPMEPSSRPLVSLSPMLPPSFHNLSLFPLSGLFTQVSTPPSSFPRIPPLFLSNPLLWFARHSSVESHTVRLDQSALVQAACSDLLLFLPSSRPSFKTSLHLWHPYSFRLPFWPFPSLRSCRLNP